MDPDLMRMPIDQVLREIWMRSMFEGIPTPNVVLILTCDDPRAIGLWNTRKVFAGEQWYLQKMGYRGGEEIPVVYKCPCGMKPCRKLGPTAMVDFLGMHVLSWPLWRNKGSPLSTQWLHPVFGLKGLDS